MLVFVKFAPVKSVEPKQAARIPVYFRAEKKQRSLLHQSQNMQLPSFITSEDRALIGCYSATQQ